MSISSPGSERATVDRKRKAYIKRLANLPSCLGPDPAPEFAVRISVRGEPFHYLGTPIYEDDPEELMDLDVALLASTAAKSAYGLGTQVEIIHIPTGREFRIEKYPCPPDDNMTLTGLVRHANAGREDTLKMDRQAAMELWNSLDGN
jgi:hypothetical protein